MDVPRIEIKNGYVLLDLGLGYVSREKHPVDLIERIGAAFSGAESRKLLIVGEGVDTELTMVGLFDRAKQASELKAQIAFAITHKSSAEKVQFMEDATLLRETRIRFFDTIEQAKEWLGVE